MTIRTTANPINEELAYILGRRDCLAPHSEVLGPFSGAMKHPQNFYYLAADPIGQNIWAPGYHEFAGIRNATGAARGGIISECGDCLSDMPCQFTGGEGIILRDNVSHADQIDHGLIEPADSHSGGLRSCDVPQVSSQALTFS